MTKATWIAAGILVAAATQVAAAPVYLGNVGPKKEVKGESGSKADDQRLPAIQQGGDNFGTATPIAAIPHFSVGTTCGFADDYYPACAFAGNSAAADVVYSFTPTEDMCVTISTCGSFYDTIVHVYDGDASNMIACNDDDPVGDCGLDSYIEEVNLSAGRTYYIVVDGYSTACGDYYLDIFSCPPPCVVECPPGSTPEGEVSCFDDYEDVTNGGCNSTPPVFTELACDDEGTTVCGTYGTYVFQGLGYRDTDWYQFTLEKASHVSYCFTGEANSLIAILDGSGGCPDAGDPPLICFDFPTECATLCCEADLPPGTYWLFAGTSDFSGVPCGTDYTFTLTGVDCPPVSVAPAAWGQVKEMYR
jgi:hypothetical protein